MINFPRRDKPAAKVGPRLDISPLQLESVLKSEHGLSSLLTAAESWEPFAWQGNALSAPLRALFAAEARGLLKDIKRPEAIAVADITAEINFYLESIERQPITESSVVNNLGKAATYLNAAVGITIVPNKKSMTVRLLGEYETQENIEKYFDDIKKKLQIITVQLDHAKSCGYDVSRVLTASQVEGANLLVAAN